MIMMFLIARNWLLKTKVKTPASFRAAWLCSSMAFLCRCSMALLCFFSIGFLWFYFGLLNVFFPPMVLLWCYYDFTMVLLLLFYGFSLVLRWYYYGLKMCFSMFLLWFYYGVTMVLLFFHYGVTMMILLLFYGFTMALLWFYYGCSFFLTWFYYGVTMVSLWLYQTMNLTDELVVHSQPPEFGRYSMGVDMMGLPLVFLCHTGIFHNLPSCPCVGAHDLMEGSQEIRLSMLVYTPIQQTNYLHMLHISHHKW